MLFYFRWDGTSAAPNFGQGAVRYNRAVQKPSCCPTPRSHYGPCPLIPNALLTLPISVRILCSFLDLISAGGLSKRSLPFLLCGFSASGLSARSPFFLFLSASGLSTRSPLAFLCVGQLFEQELVVCCCSRMSCLSYIDASIIYTLAGCFALAVCVCVCV